MAVKLALDATPTEILKAFGVWVKLLEQEDYQNAYTYTEHDDYYQWTPQLIKEVINGYGLPEPHPSGEILKLHLLARPVQRIESLLMKLTTTMNRCHTKRRRQRLLGKYGMIYH